MDYIQNFPECNKLSLVRDLEVFQCSSTYVSPQLHQVSAGMHFLHGNDIIHANLKPVLASTSSFDYMSDNLSREIFLFMKTIVLWCKIMK